jgi:hypothetical protein
MQEKNIELLPVGIHYDVPETVYRADPGLNQSLLKKFMQANSPAHFLWESTQPDELKEKDFIKIGNFVDNEVFRPGTSKNRFVVWPGERRGNEWKAFKEANKDKEILNEDEMNRAIGAYNALMAHTDAKRWITSSKHQVVVIAVHPETGIRMKGLVDLFPDITYGWIADLKTAADASLQFHIQAFKMGYAIQARYYMDLLRFNDVFMNNFAFVVVENSPYHGVQVHHFSYDQEEIIRAGKDYTAAMIAYDECRSTNTWPGYSTAWQRITFPRWALADPKPVDVIE